MRERGKALRRGGRRLLAGAGAILGILVLLMLPTLLGDVVLQYTVSPAAGGQPLFAPLAGVTTTAGLLRCASTATPTLPAGAGPAHGSVAVAEPHGCASRTRLTFLPPVRFSNGLPVPAGHALRASVSVLSTSGTTSIIRHMTIYVQSLAFGNPILSTSISIVNGLLATNATSQGAVTAAGTYGIGFRMQLLHRPTAQTFTLSLALDIVLFDGGLVRAVDSEAVSLVVTY
jgi:hypothetical protein